MHAGIVRIFSTFVFVATFAGYGSASPLSSRILSLVPPGAEIVAGFENHPDSTSGRLLLTTHNNRLDLEDWQALTGVDSSRRFDEVIEAAASDGAGDLSEHLLLVAGRLDRELIFRSLEENGVQSTGFQGQRIMVIKPFARERGDMLQDRWFVILENRIGILGTPGIVQRALQRYADHSVPDSVLEERLSLLRLGRDLLERVGPLAADRKQVRVRSAAQRLGGTAGGHGPAYGRRPVRIQNPDRLFTACPR